MSLILTRRVGERIMIGDDIILEVRGIVRGEVRLGIDAPQDVEVDREEVRIRKDRENDHG